MLPENSNLNVSSKSTVTAMIMQRVVLEQKGGGCPASMCQALKRFSDDMQTHRVEENAFGSAYDNNDDLTT